MANAGLWHISSAVIATIPDRTSSVLDDLCEMAGVEVCAHERGKIVVVIEGATTGILGDALSKISLMDGVIAANMVFEHITEEMNDDEWNADAT